MVGVGIDTMYSGLHGGGTYNSPTGTLFTSEYSPGGHYSLVNIVRGDDIHGGTLFTPTAVDRSRDHPALRHVRFEDSTCGCYCFQSTKVLRC